MNKTPKKVSSKKKSDEDLEEDDEKSRKGQTYKMSGVFHVKNGVLYKKSANKVIDAEGRVVWRDELSRGEEGVKPYFYSRKMTPEIENVFKSTSYHDGIACYGINEQQLAAISRYVSGEDKKFGIDPAQDALGVVMRENGTIDRDATAQNLRFYGRVPGVEYGIEDDIKQMRDLFQKYIMPIAEKSANRDLIKRAFSNAIGELYVVADKHYFKYSYCLPNTSGSLVKFGPAVTFSYYDLFDFEQYVRKTTKGIVNLKVDEITHDEYEKYNGTIVFDN